MNPVKKFLFFVFLVAWCLGGFNLSAQTHVVVNLSAIVGQGGITTTNRTNLVQLLSAPGVFGASIVIGDRGKFISDTNSSFTISNCAAGTYGVSVLPPPGRAYFEFTLQANETNLGTVSVIPHLSVNGAPTYPAAGATAYSMAASDARYGLSSNVLGSAAFQPVSSFQPASANLTNWAAFAPSQYVLTSAIGTAASSNASAFQLASANLTSWSAFAPSQYVLSSLIGTAALSNASAFQPASATLSNLATLNTNVFVYQSQIGTAASSNASAFQLASANLGGWSVIPTNALVYPAQLGTAAYVATTAFQAASANLTSWSAFVPSQYVLASALGTAATLNASALQPASANLTNWSALNTNTVVYQSQIGSAAASNAAAFQPAAANLTNWAKLATNLYALVSSLGAAAYVDVSVFQPANLNLSNWATINTNVLANLITGGQAGSAALTNLANGNGNALTNLNATNLVGQLQAANATNYARLNATNNFTGVNNVPVANISQANIATLYVATNSDLSNTNGLNVLTFGHDSSGIYNGFMRLWWYNQTLYFMDNFGVPYPINADIIGDVTGNLIGNATAATNLIGSINGASQITNVIPTNNLPANLAALAQNNGGQITNLASGAVLPAPVFTGLPKWPGILPTVSGVAQFVGYNGTNIYPINGPTFDPTNGFTGNGKGLTNIPLSALSVNTNIFAGTNDARTLTLGNIFSTFTGFFNGVFNGNGTGITNIPTVAIRDLNTNLFALTATLGTAAYSNAAAFYLASNPSSYVTAAVTNGLAPLFGAHLTNVTLSGTNIHGGLNLFPMWANTTLANGVNAGTKFGTNNAVRFTGPTAPFSSSGFAGGTNGAWFWAINATPQPWTILNDSGGDADGNRIFTSGGNITLSNQYSSATFVYDQASLHWIVTSVNGQTNFNGYFNGTATGTFSGNGNGLTNLNATNLTGNVPAVALTNGLFTMLQPGSNMTFSFSGTTLTLNSSGQSGINGAFFSGTGNTTAGFYNSVVGFNNSVDSSATSCFAGGDQSSATGNMSFAYGYGAQAKHSDSFVWNSGADSGLGYGSPSPWGTTASGQYLIRAYGGVGINTTNLSTNALSVAGTAAFTQVNVTNFMTLKNNVTGPTGAQLGVNGSAFWSSNGIVYCSISTDGSTISTVKQIAP